MYDIHKLNIKKKYVWCAQIICKYNSINTNFTSDINLTT